MKQSHHSSSSMSPRSAAASLESVSHQGMSFPAQTKKLQKKDDPSQLAAAEPKKKGKPASPKMDPSQLTTDPKKKGKPASPKMDPSQLVADPKKKDKTASPKMDPAQKKDDVSSSVSAGSALQMKMNEEVQGKMESVFNTSFSDVNIHVGDKASSVGALAYTQGNDIHFAQGKFAPETKSGAELLGHELTHVVQQRQGRVQANTSINGLPVNNDPGLEKEADNMGSKAAGLF